MQQRKVFRPSDHGGPLVLPSLAAITVIPFVGRTAQHQRRRASADRCMPLSGRVGSLDIWTAQFPLTEELVVKAPSEHRVHALEAKKPLR